MTKTMTVDLKHVIALRDHHLAEAKRYDDVLAVLKTVQARTRKTERTVDAVRARVARTPAPHVGPRGGTSPAARRAVLKRAGQTPMDHIKRALAGGATLTPEQMAAIVLPHVAAPAKGGERTLSKDGIARRSVGVIVQRLTKAKLARLSGDGLTATAKLTASLNGSGA